MHSIEKYVSGIEFDFSEGNDELLKLVASQCLKLTDIPMNYYHDLVSEAYKRVLEHIRERKSLKKGSISTIVYYSVLNAKTYVYTKYILPVSVSRIQNADPILMNNLFNNTVSLDKPIDDEGEITLADILPTHERSYERIETSNVYNKIKEEAKKILDDRSYYIFFSYIEKDKTFDEIAKDVGLSRQRVNMIFYKTKRKLMASPKIRKLLIDLKN